MPTAKELLDAGQLGAAIEATTAEVKANPTDVLRRTTLFELLCFAGEWDRAEKQIDVLAQQSAQAAIGRPGLSRQHPGRARARSASSTPAWRPHFLNEPPSYVDKQLEAIAQLRQGDAAGARAALDAAEEARPAIAGQVERQAVSTTFATTTI